ncbi:MAG: hypothetical protein NT018_10020 [Armatimonadetes bacterium]|nr:hypothetical protein [Armatimonadota bacterium]
MGSVLGNQRSSGGGSKPKTIWWIGLACAVVIILVCYLFMRQPTGQNQVPTKASPKEVAQAFLGALANGDRSTANAMLQSPALDDPKTWDMLNGLKLTSLGEPVTNPQHRGGWFVPFAAQLKNGQMVNSQVSVRNDLPGGQWQVDGF